MSWRPGRVSWLLGAQARRPGSVTEADGWLVRGDNLAVLRGPLAELTGRDTVDACLADPPYNTGSPDWPYDDARAAWAAFARPRLAAVRDRLTPAGLLVWHIDEHEIDTLRRLVAEVFGAGALGIAVWDKRNPKGDAVGVATQHEYLVFATPERAALKAAGGLRRPKLAARALQDKAAALVAEAGGVTEAARSRFRRWVARQRDWSGGVRAYRELDEHGRVFRKASMAWPNKKTPPDAYFEPLVHPRTGQPCPVPLRGWRAPPDTLRRWVAEGRVVFGTDHTTQPTRKLLLEDHLLEPVPSVLAHGGADDALLRELGVAFPFAKPLGITRQLLDMVARPDGAMVLDPFAGSGTTAHALLQHDRAHGGRRRALLVEESATFHEVLVPRVRAALSREGADDRAIAVVDPAVVG